MKDLQRQAYQEEIKAPIERNLLPSSNNPYFLDVLLERDAVLKVGGRLRCSALPSSVKPPLFIPREHHITRLIIAHYRERIGFPGQRLYYLCNPVSWLLDPRIKSIRYILNSPLCGLSETKETCGRTEDEGSLHLSPTVAWIVSVRNKVKRNKRYGLPFVATLFSCPSC